MIQARELRLGNWVKDRGGKYIRIDYFEHLQDGYSCKFGMSNYVEGWGDLHDWTEYTDYADPIPLTPEILEKAGFEFLSFGGAGMFYYKDGVYVSEYMNYLNCDPYGNTEHSVKISHLHQLQNLFFALTGTDLPLTFY